jgi:AcrR family transcriptional regulator
MAATKPRRTKKEQAEATRSAIIEAAIRLFARTGFVSTTTQDIARAIKMTPGVLYWHFKDKEDLLVAVLVELEKRQTADLAMGAQMSREQKLNAAQMLERLIGRVAATLEHYHEVLVLVGVIGAEITDMNPRVEKALRSMYKRFADVLGELVKQGVREGIVDDKLDVECATQMFMGLYMGGILHQRLFRDEFPLPRALPVIRHMLFSSLMPKAAASRAVPIAPASGA